MTWPAKKASDRPDMSVATRLVGSAVGAAAGLAATAAMTGVLAVAAARGWLGRPPPEKIVEHAAPDLSASDRKPVTVVSHFAFGAGAGAFYGLLGGWRAKSRLMSGLQGVGFGLTVWAVSYEGWVPALKIMPPAHRDRPARSATMVVAHIIYGAVLGLLMRRGK